MNPGPLRRLSGAFGLLGLAPVAWLLANGAITLPEAALRASATLVVVVVVGRAVGWVLGGLAGSFERDSQDGGGATPQAPAEPAAPRSTVQPVGAQTDTREPASQLPARR